jgi:hypothetical protein
VQQLVQAAHATLEAGLKAGDSLKLANPSSLVLLEATNEAHLLQIHSYLVKQNIDCSLFYEPDDDLGYQPGYTALATRPLSKEARKHFKNFRLYKAPIGEHHHG